MSSDGLRLANLLSEAQRITHNRLPGLEVKLETGILVLEGNYDVWAAGEPLTTFEDIRIEIAADFPHAEPLLFERAGRIPQSADRHMYPGSAGRCCYGVWIDWLCGEQSLSRFLLDTVNDFFFSQFYFDIHTTWPLGERSHGMQGIVEAVAERLDLPPRESAVVSALSFLNGERLVGACPCGSGQPFRSCHQAQLRDRWCKLPRVVREMMTRTFLGEPPSDPAPPTFGAGIFRDARLWSSTALGTIEASAQVLPPAPKFRRIF